MNQEAFVNIAGLVCRLSGNTALDGVTLTIESGALFGLVGPNGAGKTTLLRAMAGAVGPDSGTVLVAGLAPHSTPPPELARVMAVLPQHPAAPAGMTVRETVAWGRNPHLGRLSPSGKRDRLAVSEALLRTRTSRLADRPVDELSGGERHRVMIARALAQSPRILLLDEPTVHLDIGHQVEIMETLKSLASEGMTVVAALHDLNLAAAYCDRLALLSRGRLLACGAPSEVLTPDLIQQAYGTSVSVRVNRATGRPYLVASAPVSPAESGPKVHVVCGGGTGADALAHLARSGYRVSVGVLHVMDADDEAARALGLRVVEEAPFSPIGAGAAAEATRLARGADVVLVAPVPIGPGNLRNLDVAQSALDAGVPVVVVGSTAGGDFAGGAAAERIAGLIAKGARLADDLWAALEAIGVLAPLAGKDRESEEDV